MDGIPNRSPTSSFCQRLSRKVVDSRMSKHISRHRLLLVRQSAYCLYQSTETAVASIHITHYTMTWLAWLTKVTLVLWYYAICGLSLTPSTIVSSWTYWDDGLELMAVLSAGWQSSSATGDRWCTLARPSLITLHCSSVSHSDQLLVCVYLFNMQRMSQTFCSVRKYFIISLLMSQHLSASD